MTSCDQMLARRTKEVTALYVCADIHFFMLLITIPFSDETSDLKEGSFENRRPPCFEACLPTGRSQTLS